MASFHLPPPPLPSLRTLPVEILSMIGAGCEWRDIAALRRVNRLFDSVYGEEFYTRNVKEYNTDLAVWAAANSQTKVLDRLFKMNKEITQQHWIVESRYLDRHTDFLRLDDPEWGIDIVCTLSHVAAASGHNDVIKWLVSHGADLQLGIWRYGFSPKFAPTPDRVSCGCDCTLWTLASWDRGLNPSPNWTPLHMAICHGQTRTVQLLLAHGVTADMTWPPRSAETTDEEEYISALAVAASHGYADIVKLLFMREDCDPHHADHYGNNTLCYAGCRAYHPTVIAMLLAAGTDPLHRSYHPDQYEVMPMPFEKALDECRYSEALSMWKAGGDRWLQEADEYAWRRMEEHLKHLFGRSKSYHCCESCCETCSESDCTQDTDLELSGLSSPSHLPPGRLQDEWREAREAIAVAFMTASPAKIRLAREHRSNFKSPLSCSLWVALHSTVRSVERVLIDGADPNSWIYRDSEAGETVATPLTYLATRSNTCINDRKDKIRLLLAYGARLDGPREPLRLMMKDPFWSQDVEEYILKHSTQRNLPHAYAARMALEIYFGTRYESFRRLASYFKTTTCSLTRHYVQVIVEDALIADRAEPLRILTELGIISRDEVSRRASARELPKVHMWLDSMEDIVGPADGCGRWCYELDMYDDLEDHWGPES
ncbi:uncharacterized protein E0L32_009661 [Thyridium curvatum]|uniref:Uncharacterized protein n=1 Tax=Thyridium curvatum TaxID=1093900 RepID=A0A507AMF1_9PEZI|nr:uncharacterized protein E0L32_009661 [Thyridium curvatum]TPX08843.1 hypothetical protein E0L32_009661 [Thyridium curvatum]